MFVRMVHIKGLQNAAGTNIEGIWFGGESLTFKIILLCTKSQQIKCVQMYIRSTYE